MINFNPISLNYTKPNYSAQKNKINFEPKFSGKSLYKQAEKSKVDEKMEKLLKKFEEAIEKVVKKKEMPNYSGTIEDRSFPIDLQEVSKLNSWS